MTVEIVSSSLYNHLQPLFDRTERVDFAIAFLKKSGTDLFTQLFSRLHDRGHRIRIIFSTAFGLTEPRALADLAAFGAFLHVLRPADEEAGIFHAKLWIFHLSSGEVAVIVGSSNLTRSALISNTELNVLLTGDRSEPVIADCLKLFEGLWLSPNSEIVSSEFIAEYGRSLPPILERNRKSRKEIAKFVRPTMFTDKSITSRFSKVILAALGSGPLATHGLYEIARAQVPQLCDDSIPCPHEKGQGSGLEWQHLFRGAESALKNSGKIRRSPDRKRWQLV